MRFINLKKIKNKIAYRLLFYILLFSGAVTVIITAAQLFIEYQRDLDAIHAEFNRVETIFEKTLVESLWFFNEPSLRLQLEGILNLRNIEYLELSGEGDISINLGRKKSRHTIESHLPLIYTGENMTRKIGNLKIIADLTGVYSRLFDRLVTILITQSIKTFLVSIFIYTLFHFFLIRHMTSIGAYLKNYELKSPPRFLDLQRKSQPMNDELDQIVSTINEIAMKLFKSYETINAELLMRKEAEKNLIRAYQGLEQVVLQRTRSLKKERDRAQNYLDVAAVVMVAINSDQEVSLINKKGCEILGYDEAEIIGKNWLESFIPERDKDMLMTVLEKVMSETGDSGKYFENSVLTRSGEIRLIAWHNTVMKDDDGSIIGTLSSGEDITDRRRAEKEREILQEQLMHSRKMESVGSLAGGVAHEFNNILSIIIGNTELAMDDIPASHTAADCLTEIQEASLRAKEIVRQLLGFAQKSVFQLVPVSLCSLVEETLTLIRSSILSSVRIQQRLSCDADRIMADASQIKLVLFNLCANAENAMQETGGILSVTVSNITLDASQALHYDGMSAGEYVRLSVADTGIGIDSKIIDRIFDPYFTTMNLAEKSGMGLAVVHGIVKHHNGAIVVKSVPGKGTDVEILFPIEKGEENDGDRCIANRCPGGSVKNPCKNRSYHKGPRSTG